MAGSSRHMGSVEAAYQDVDTLARFGTEDGSMKLPIWTVGNKGLNGCTCYSCHKSISGLPYRCKSWTNPDGIYRRYFCLEHGGVESNDGIESSKREEE